MVPRILLIGGTRFIGAHAARRFAEGGADVTVFHRGQSQSAIVPASVVHVCDAMAEYPITHFPEALTARDWDVVVHMVAMGEADTRAAVEAFAGHAGRLVLISSSDVYRAYGRLTGHEPGPPDPVPLTEAAPLRTALYPYRAAAKRMGAYAHDYEKILAEAAVRDGALPHTILRLPKVYGPGDNASLPTVYGFANQPHWRWTHGHVENVAAAIVLGATHAAAAGRIYNVGEAQTPTMGERLARLPAYALAGVPPRFDYRQDMAADTSRIRAELDYADAVDEIEAMHALAAAAQRIGVR